MDISITKEEFEGIVPVAKSGHDNVYKTVVGRLQDTYLEVREELLGSVGDDGVEKDETLLWHLKTYVTLRTFLQLMEQLDVVLTPTGFGVVANDHVAPASSSRVTAARESLERSEQIARSYLIEGLTQVEGWGDQVEAERAIDVPLWSYKQLSMIYGPRLSTSDYHKKIDLERASMREIREWIGDETVDFCLNGVRCHRKDDYQKVTRIIERVIVACIDGDMVQKDTLYRKLLLTLERNLETYTLYAESDEYKANIAERYENKQEDSAFFFG